MVGPVLLELTTKPEPRGMVAIDGQAFPLRGFFDLSIGQLRTFEVLVSRVGELALLEMPTAEQEAELHAALVTLSRLAVKDAPDDVLDAVCDGERMVLCKLFADRITPRIHLIRRSVTAAKE